MAQPKSPRRASSNTYTWDTSGSLPDLLTDGDNYYLYGNDDHPYAQISTTTAAITYLQSDIDGSTVATTDTTGTRTGTWTYDPYGNITAHAGTATTPYGYAGEYRDTDTGLTYLRARDYDPTNGSFLTRDPLESATANPYSYTSGNPLQYADPTGMLMNGVFGDIGRATAQAEVNFFNGLNGGLSSTVANTLSPGASDTLDRWGLPLGTCPSTGDKISKWLAYGSGALITLLIGGIGETGTAAMRQDSYLVALREASATAFERRPQGMTPNAWGNAIWGAKEGDAVALTGARSRQELLDVPGSNIETARLFLKMYEAAARAGRGGDTAPERVALMKNIIQTLKGGL